MQESSISNFINSYSASAPLRLHMPGHKGAFGNDSDITEVTGADSLYEAGGIILESENKTSELFGTGHTYYGTEGSSQMIKAMCSLAVRWTETKRPVIAASRNAHKSFIHAAMLLGFDIIWLPSEDEEYSLLRCTVTPEGLKRFLGSEAEKKEVAAVYITSPDYLGNILDIRGLAEAAHSFGIMLLVDNAHGSYLKFMDRWDGSILNVTDMHPITLGADMAVDSAHKTLPVLTGGAYLHISENAPEFNDTDIRERLLMFGSTSPSYLILRSLDEMPARASKKLYMECAEKVSDMKNVLEEAGYSLSGNEPLKMTFDLSDMKMSGKELLAMLHEKGIECEYADRDYLVTMWSPYLPDDAYETFINVMKDISADVLKPAGSEKSKYIFKLPEVVLSPREVMYKKHETRKISDNLIGCVAADTYMGCPPAVSPIVAGEKITKEIIDILRYYETTSVKIVKM